MQWYISPEKQILALETEADALTQYMHWQEFDTVECAIDMVDAICAMEETNEGTPDANLYREALQAFCDAPADYVKDELINTYEYKPGDTEYANARALYTEIAEVVEEILINRGYVRQSLVLNV